jgi:hypothetical protein
MPIPQDGNIFFVEFSEEEILTGFPSFSQYDEKSIA